MSTSIKSIKEQFLSSTRTALNESIEAFNSKNDFKVVLGCSEGWLSLDDDTAAHLHRLSKAGDWSAYEILFCYLDILFYRVAIKISSRVQNLSLIGELASVIQERFFFPRTKGDKAGTALFDDFDTTRKFSAFVNFYTGRAVIDFWVKKGKTPFRLKSYNKYRKKMIEAKEALVEDEAQEPDATQLIEKYYSLFNKNLPNIFAYYFLAHGTVYLNKPNDEGEEIDLESELLPISDVLEKDDDLISFWQSYKFSLSRKTTVRDVLLSKMQAKVFACISKEASTDEEIHLKNIITLKSDSRGSKIPTNRLVDKLKPDHPNITSGVFNVRKSEGRPKILSTYIYLSDQEADPMISLDDLQVETLVSEFQEYVAGA